MKCGCDLCDVVYLFAETSIVLTKMESEFLVGWKSAILVFRVWEEKTNPFWKNEMRKNYPRQIHFHELNIVERKAIWATEMDSFTDRSNWFDPIDNRHERTMVRGEGEWWDRAGEWYGMRERSKSNLQ